MLYAEERPELCQWTGDEPAECWQGEGGKATGAMSCKSLNLIMGRKSESSHNVASLRTDSWVYFNWKCCVIWHNPGGFWSVLNIIS